MKKPIHAKSCKSALLVIDMLSDPQAKKCVNIKENRLVTMHIFLDRSIIEVFINGNVLTGRTFPGSDMLGVDIYSKGDTFYINLFSVIQNFAS